MPARNWADLRAPDFPVSGDSLAVLPVAAIEQHGPHLPMGTDLMIAEGLLDSVRAECPDDLDLLILPVQAVGKSNEHAWAAGTLTLSAATVLAAWSEICRSVARAGVRRLVIVNSHGGNADVISILARELRVDPGLLAVRCSWGVFGFPEGLFSAREMAHGLHGGDIETSLMLAFRPYTVDMTAARDFPSAAEHLPVAPTGGAAFGWISSDLNPEGVVGEAHEARAEKGRATAAHQARGFIALCRDIQAMDWPPEG